MRRETYLYSTVGDHSNQTVNHVGDLVNWWTHSVSMLIAAFNLSQAWYSCTATRRSRWVRAGAATHSSLFQLIRSSSTSSSTLRQKRKRKGALFGYKLKGKCHEMDIFICSLCVCANGFQGLSKALHFTIQLLTLSMLLWIYLLILKMLTETLLIIPFSVIDRCSPVSTFHWL